MSTKTRNQDDNVVPLNPVPEAPDFEDAPLEAYEGDPEASTKKRRGMPRMTLDQVAKLLSRPPWESVLASNERTAETVLLERPPVPTAHKSFPAALVDEDLVSIVLWVAAKFGASTSTDNTL